MKKLLFWFKELWHWLVEACLLWLTVAVAAIALVLAFRKGIDEATIRITGLVLQLLGIGTVAWGIRVTRKFFGRPSILTLLRQWFNHFPRFAGRTIAATANIHAISMTGNARGHVWRHPGPDATIEDRVKAIEDNLQDVNQRLCSTQTEIDQGFREQTGNLKHEQDMRSRADQEIREKLEATETGGLHISAMGVLWLFIGIIMSTIPAELSRWVN